jgi:hypothetical protein
MDIRKCYCMKALGTNKLSYGRKLTTENTEKANRQAGFCQYNNT